MDDETNEQCFGVIPTIVAKCGSYLKEEGTACTATLELGQNENNLPKGIGRFSKTND